MLPSVKKFVFALSITVACFLIMRPFTPLNIVQFELAGSVEVAAKIISEWTAEQINNVKVSIYLDFVFILAYCAAFMFACQAASIYSAVQGLIRMGSSIASLVWMAGVCDAIENIALLKALVKISQPSVSVAFYFATIKFAILTLALLFVMICVAIGFLQKVKGNQ